MSVSVVGVLGALAGPLVSLVKNSVSGAKKTARIAVENAKQRAGSIAEAIIIGIWCYPFITSFLPVLAPYTRQGFAVIDQLPDWYVDGFYILSMTFVGVTEVKRAVRR